VAPEEPPMAECHPFIEWKDGKFVVNRSACEKLDALPCRKIQVVSIVGPYRSGKSFLINQIVGRDAAKGFNVGGTVNACTKGIWMTITPSPVLEDVCIVYLDSEGLGSVEKEPEFDAHVFALCALLSSMLILNTTGCISKTTIEQLELVVHLAEHIQASAEGKRPNEDNGAAAELTGFPSLLWVLRDFALALEDEDGKAITPREYLENGLSAKNTHSTRQQQANQIRHALTQIFKNRDCMTLVRPVSDEAKLRNLSELPLHRLRAEFKNQVKAICKRVHEAAPFKTVDGQYINGPALARLAQVYVRGLNGGALPKIRTAWRSVIEIQGAHALERSLKVYKELCPQATDEAEDGGEILEPYALANAHIQARDRAFDLVAWLGLGDLKDLKRKLAQRIDEVWSERQSKNYVMSVRQSSATAKRLWLKSGLGSTDPIQDPSWLSKMDELVENYLEEAKGAARNEIGWRFFSTKMHSCMRSLASHVIASDKAHVDLKQRVLKLDSKLKDAEKKITDDEKRWKGLMTQKQTDWKEEREMLMEEVQRLLVKLQDRDNQAAPPNGASGAKGRAAMTASGKPTAMVGGGTSTKSASRYHLSLLVQHAADEDQGVERTDVRNFFWSSLKGVFNGRAFVDWMVLNGWAVNRKDGIDIGQQLLNAGLLCVKRGRNGFVDDNNRYYQLLDPSRAKFPSARPGVSTKPFRPKQNRKATGPQHSKGGQSRTKNRSMSTSVIPSGDTKSNGNLPSCILYGMSVPTRRIMGELNKTKALTLQPAERIVYFYINSLNPNMATRNMTINLTRHCVMVTSVRFAKFEAGIVSQCFRLIDIVSSTYLGFSRSGLAKVKVFLREGKTSMIHFVNGRAAVWFAKRLGRFASPSSDRKEENSKHQSPDTTIITTDSSSPDKMNASAPRKVRISSSQQSKKKRAAARKDPRKGPASSPSVDHDERTTCGTSRGILPHPKRVTPERR